MNGVLENHSRGPVPFAAKVEYHPISVKDQSRLHQFGKTVLPGMYLGNVLIAGGIWKGDMLVADLEELENFGRLRNPRSTALCKRKC